VDTNGSLLYFQQLHQQEVVGASALLVLEWFNRRFRWWRRWKWNAPRSGGTGNTPPVSPPQGNPGGIKVSPPNSGDSGGGGGGAGAVGGKCIWTWHMNTAGAGGNGLANSISGFTSNLRRWRWRRSFCWRSRNNLELEELVVEEQEVIFWNCRTAGTVNTGGGGGGARKCNPRSWWRCSWWFRYSYCKSTRISRTIAASPGTNTVTTLPAPAGGCKVATFTVSGDLTIS
jgi:hypothetical protein